MAKRKQQQHQHHRESNPMHEVVELTKNLVVVGATVQVGTSMMGMLGNLNDH